DGRSFVRAAIDCDSWSATRTIARTSGSMHDGRPITPHNVGLEPVKSGLLELGAGLTLATEPELSRWVSESGGHSASQPREKRRAPQTSRIRRGARCAMRLPK